MSVTLLDEMKAYIGFGPEDVANVVSLAGPAEKLVPVVVNRFYEELLKHATTRAVFTGGPAQIERLEGLLGQWLRELFGGEYDARYYARRSRIGTRHVEVGLPQRYMFLGMELIWQELSSGLRRARPPRADAKLASLHKLLTLDLSIMLETYQTGYADLTRRTERATMEAKLTRAEHLAEIGQLAASLAHEIKNPLAGISGAIQIIGDSLPAENPHKPIVGDILRQISRLDATVKDLLLYARPTPPLSKETPINDVLARVLTLLREEPAVQRVRIEQDASVRRAAVYADEGQFEQVLMNLILNAAQASPAGASVRIAAERDGRCTRITVTDAGAGMSEEVRSRALAPFFTTKAQGTGLGLTICRRIVEAHGGMLHLASREGQGTTATVELPDGANYGGPQRE